MFVVFDLEVAFLFAWAVAFEELGWTGFIGAAAFIGILVVSLVYEWRQGTFDWGPRVSDVHVPSSFANDPGERASIGGART
jgi:hypothetical protein